MADDRRGRIQVFEVVEHQQHLAVAKVLLQRVRRLDVGARVVDAERTGDRIGHEVGIPELRQVDEEDAVGELDRELRGGLQREPGLADAARAGQREQADARIAEQRAHVGDLGASADQGRDRRREVASGPDLGRLDQQLGILAEDRCLQALELRSGVEALPGERGPGVEVRLQRLRLPSTPVQREHQLPPKPLPERVLRDEVLQLADDARMTSERQVGVDAVLEDGETRLLETNGRPFGDGLVREVAQRRAAPQRERVPERGGRRTGVSRRESRLALHCMTFEAPRVDGLGIDDQRVAAGPGLDHTGIVAERPAQHGHRHLQPGRGTGVVRSPQLLDHPVGGHDLPRVQHEERHERTLLAAAHVDGPAVTHDLDRAQDAELERHAERTLAFC